VLSRGGAGRWGRLKDSVPTMLWNLLDKYEELLRQSRSTGDVPDRSRTQDPGRPQGGHHAAPMSRGKEGTRASGSGTFVDPFGIFPCAKGSPPRSIAIRHPHRGAEEEAAGRHPRRFTVVRHHGVVRPRGAVRLRAHGRPHAHVRTCALVHQPRRTPLGVIAPCRRLRRHPSLSRVVDLEKEVGEMKETIRKMGVSIGDLLDHEGDLAAHQKDYKVLLGELQRAGIHLQRFDRNKGGGGLRRT